MYYGKRKMTALLRHGFLSTTAFGGLLLSAGQAAAQAVPSEASPDVATEVLAEDESQAIVVTGSRIANPNLNSASPVTVVGSEEFEATGTTRVEDLINQLPQAFTGQNAADSNGATGTATVNLRGIGSTRTLVLVNGRRLMPGDPTSPVADLNAIPAALIERVDVLTGGASSVYGSDAIAGVVNFVLDDNFEGLRLDAQVSTNFHENDADQRIIDALEDRNFSYPQGNTVAGRQFDVNLTMGTNFDDGRGNVTAYAGYRDISAVLQGEYDYSSCALTPSTTTDTFSCGGSGTTAPAQFQFYRNDFSALTALTLDPAVTDGAGFRSYVGSRDAYNYQPLNYFQRPDERYTFGAFANYEISPAIQPYLELNFMDDRTVAQIAESGAFGVEYSINCNGTDPNPLLSAAQLAAACSPARTAARPDDPSTPIDESDPAQNSVTAIVLRRNIEGGGRQSDLRHTSYRVVTGLRGDIGSNWNYDGYLQFGRTVFSEYYGREFGNTRLSRALDVVADPVTGQAVCRSVLNGTDPNCVPYNVYTEGGVTQEALDYLQIGLFADGQTTEQIASFSIFNSDLGFGSPWSDTGIGVALGAEYRKESIEFRTDENFALGEGAGQGGPTPSLPGTPSFNVKELFGEARIPIIESSFIEELSIEVGYRYSDYSTAGTTDTYKILANFAPIDEVRFRGGYNRAVRAPNIIELYDPQGLGLFGGDDPCDGAVDDDPTTESPTFTLEQCQRTGVSATQYGTIPDNPADQWQQFTGGNQNLEPEVADTYTAGVVVTLGSGFLNGLTVSADYFDIEVNNLIGTVGAQIILDQCGLTGAEDLCSLIQRDAAGSLFLQTTGYVTNTNINIGGVQTKGVDLAASYRVPLGGSLGDISLSLTGTYLDSFVTRPGVIDPDTGVESYECVGLYGTNCGQPAPKWRHNLRATYDAVDDWSLSVRWRFVGPSDSERTSDNPFLSGAVQIPVAEIKPYSYFDLSASFTPIEEFTLRLGIQNILDKDPPAGNIYAGTYSWLGRYAFLGASLNF